MIKVNRVTAESNLDGIGENKPLSSVSVTASTPSTGPKTTCSVKLVDIGPKISAGGTDNHALTPLILFFRYDESKPSYNGK